MRVVVDTNVLLNAIFPNASNSWLFEEFLVGKISFCVSTDILSEYQEVIERRFSAEIAESFILALMYSPYLIKTDIYYNWNLLTNDLDDNKFVDCAIASNASYIITHDKHFDLLKTISFPKVVALKPEEFKINFKP